MSFGDGRPLHVIVSFVIQLMTFSMPHINGNIAQLRPTKRMVEIVFAKVVLGKIGDVCGLDVGNIGRVEKSNVHDDVRLE